MKYDKKRIAMGVVGAVAAIGYVVFTMLPNSGHEYAGSWSGNDGELEMNLNITDTTIELDGKSLPISIVETESGVLARSKAQEFRIETLDDGKVQLTIRRLFVDDEHPARVITLTPATRKEGSES
ncbi:hypothetical protein J4N45_11205 [Vibrio sp. SCSIO 43140]|uniref:hypothetical protein n=1 Tax=Vibrio sp. SCSIO 43140 TaxID=2819100 RepID=UPI0020765786|nr:hypothetical protein [Vibrio sp. SCSIO 43140]USD59099.1 hypothetical protein J4N45_11205 [Vibrio sp. SCSIO 43140]